MDAVKLEYRADRLHIIRLPTSMAGASSFFLSLEAAEERLECNGARRRLWLALTSRHGTSTTDRGSFKQIPTPMTC